MKNLEFNLSLLGLNSVIICLCFLSCNLPQPDCSTLLTANIREAMGHTSTLKLAQEIRSVTYVPLEVTMDNASLIDGVCDYAVTRQYIYILPVKEPRIAMFDRQGHFVKTLCQEGQGPGEFSGLLTCIQADESNNRLYLFSGDRLWEYSLDGKYIGQSNLKHQVILIRHTDEDHFAAVSFPFRPFDEGCFGLGIFTGDGDTIAMKSDFYSSLLPREQSGFTVNMAASYSDQESSILFKTGSNDTIVRVSGEKISAVCVLDLKNSDSEIIRSLDITDFTDLNGEKRDPKDIFVSDLFETSTCYYFRCRHNQGHFVASVDKRTGETLVEKCEQPVSLKELANGGLLHGMLGTRSYQGFPVWGRVIGKELVQVVTFHELGIYKSLSSISIPESLDLKEEEGNPIFVFYSLKDSLRK